MTMLFSNVVHMMKVNFVTTFTLFLGQVGIMAIITITGMELIQVNNAYIMYAIFMMKLVVSKVRFSCQFLRLYGRK